MKQRFFTHLSVSLITHVLIVFFAIFYLSASSSNPEKIQPQMPSIKTFIYQNSAPKHQQKVLAEKKSLQKMANAIQHPKYTNKAQKSHIEEKTNLSTQSQQTLLNLLHRLIAEQQIYPEISLEQHETGRVTLNFLLDVSGNISNIRVLQSSGYPALDAAAIQAVNAIAPVKVAGQYLKENSFFSIDVVFNI